MTEKGSKYTREQELLAKIRDDRCGGNAAQLARDLEKDSTYINRLFYPIGKKGRKGIGLEIMRKASEVYKLPPGYWEGADSQAAKTPEPEPKGAVLFRPTPEELEMLQNFQRLLDHDRQRIADEIALLAARAFVDVASYIRKHGAAPISPTPSMVRAAKKDALDLAGAAPTPAPSPAPAPRKKVTEGR